MLLGTDGSFTANLAGAGSREIVVAPGASVDVTGGVVSTGNAVDTLVVGGSLTGGGASVDLGGGDDRVVSNPGGVISDLALSTGDGADVVQLLGTTTGVGVSLGAGDDTAAVGGAASGLGVDLGRGNDRLIVYDTATGELSVSDPARSWVRAGRSQINENDQLIVAAGGGQVVPVDPANPGAGVVRLDPETGQATTTITTGGDTRQVEVIGVVDDAGNVTTLQEIAPEVRRRAGFLGFLANALKIGGLLTGQFYLSAAGSALGGAYDIVNGADPLSTVLTTGTGILGPATGTSWLAPAGQTIVAAGTGDWAGAAISGLGVAAGIDADTNGIPIADSTYARLGGTLSGGLALSNALNGGDPLAAVAAGLSIADAATGTTDQRVFDQAGSLVGLAGAAATNDPWALLTNAVTAYQAFQPPTPAPEPAPAQERESVEVETSAVPGEDDVFDSASFALGGDLFPGIGRGRADLADGEVSRADGSSADGVVSDIGLLPAWSGTVTELALGDPNVGFLNVADDSADFSFGGGLFGGGADWLGLSPDVSGASTGQDVFLASAGDDVTGLFSGQDPATVLDAQNRVLTGDDSQLLAQNTPTTSTVPVTTDSGLRTIPLVGSGRPGVTQGLVTRAPTGDGREEIIVTPAREPDGTVSALIPEGSPFDATQPAQTYLVPAGTRLVRVTGSSPGTPGALQPINGVPGFVTPSVQAPVGGVTPSVPPLAAGDRPVETGSEPPAPGIPPNLVRAPIYAGSGAIAGYLLNRSINPNLTLGDYLPLGARGFAQDLVLGGALPEIVGFDPLTTALLNGARGATITQGLNVAARRGLNPALNSISDQRNPGGAPANVRSDFAVGLKRIEIPLLDPTRLTVSPNASLNIDPPLRIDVGTLPPGAVTPIPDPLTGRFLVPPTGGVDPTARLGQEFVTTPSARLQPLPPEWSTGVLPSRQVTPQQRQLEALADRLGLGNQLPNRQAELTVFDLTNAPPAVQTQAQRMTDLTVTGINFGVPLANLAVDQALEATGQGDNVALGTLARGVATGIGVGVPISIAEGRLVSGAFLHPTWQSILADTATRAVLSVAPAPVQQAVGDACSDANPAINAGKWFVCNVGQNPNQNPPTLPPAGSGGAVVTDLFPPAGGSPVAITAPPVFPDAQVVTAPVNGAGTAVVPSPAVDRAGLLRAMQDGQRELLGRGVQADTAAQVFNNLPGIAQQFGLTPREGDGGVGGHTVERVGAGRRGPGGRGPGDRGAGHRG